MKHYHILTATTALAMAALVIMACNKEEVETTEGSTKVVAGKLDDNKGSKALPEGYRLTAVGAFDYFYTDGVLNRINVRGNDIEVTADAIRLSSEGNETVEMTVNKNNLITKITATYVINSLNGVWNLVQNIDLTYNSKNQLSSITGTSTESGNEGKVSFSNTTRSNFSFEYVNKGLKKVVKQTTTSGTDVSGNISGKSRTAYTFYHEDANDNIFGQWLPNAARHILSLGDLGNALAYAGFFGRASNKLPLIIFEDLEKEVNGKTIYDEKSYKCRFTLNSYGAIQNADGYDYIYTDIYTSNSDVKATRSNAANPLPLFDEQPTQPLITFPSHSFGY